MRCGRRSRASCRGAGPSCRRSSGGNSPTTCSGTGRTCRSARCATASPTSPGSRMPRCCAPGSVAGPATRSSMPACASSGRLGWMHNRVRMIVACFLVKHLLQPWQAGRGLVLGHAGRCRPRRTMPSTGSGWRAAAPTPRRISGSSTRCCRARNSTPPATMSAASCRSWPAAGQMAPPPLGGAARGAAQRRRHARAGLSAARHRPRRGSARGRWPPSPRSVSRRRHGAHRVNDAATADLRRRGFAGLRVVGDVHGDAAAFAHSVAGAEAESCCSCCSSAT